MINKIKSIILMIVFILPLLLYFGSCSSVIEYKNTDEKSTQNAKNELDRVASVRSNRLSDEDYYWGLIEIISEPILGQNKNLGISKSAKIAVENDKIYLVWADTNNTNNSGTDYDIFYRYYDGTTWSEIQVISEPFPGKNFNTGESSNPAIAVENGSIYIVWYDNNNTNNGGVDKDIFYRCNLTGSGWEDMQVISEPIVGNDKNIGVSRDPDIAVENDKIYVAWFDWNNTNSAGNGDNDIFYRCNLTGTSWEDIQVISEPVPGKNINTGISFNPAIITKNDKIYVVWVDYNNTNGAGSAYSDIFYRCNLTGSSWEPVQVISEPILGKDFNTGESSNPAIAINNDKIYVVWEDNNNTYGASGGFPPDLDIFYRCNLTGSGWEPAQVISEPVIGSDINQGISTNPAIAVENSKIYVVWEDNNNTNSAGGDSDIFYRCNLTDANWEPVQVISEPVVGNDNNIGQSQNPDIIANLNESYVVWTDKNNTNGAGTDEDIFFKSKTLPLFLNHPKVTPTSGNTSTYFNFTITYTHLKNNAPSEITVNISGTNYSMIIVDVGNTNYKDGKSYYYNTRLNINNNHTYQFWASDGNYIAFTAIFDNPDVYNTPPNITTENNITAFEDIYYDVNYEYDDIDRENVGQIGIWNFSSNTTWLNFNPTTAMLYGTPANDDVGSYWVNISIHDTMDIDFTNFTLTVININDNPLINTSNVEITYEDELYEVDYNATDIDSLIEKQMWSLETNASSWLDMDSETGILNGTPTNDEVGDYWVNVSVIDGDDGLVYTNFTLIVLNVNDRPEITTVDELIANTNILYIVDYNATDIDSPSSQLAWSIDTNATWLNIDLSTGILSGTPTNSDLGWYDVNVSVNDGDDGSDWHEFILTVEKSNEPPVITTIDKVSITAGKSYNVIYEATDDRTPINSLIWSHHSNASWLSFNKITRALIGNPTLSHLGWYWVNVTVNDGEGGFDSHNFTLTVYATANEPPDILTEDNTNAVVGEIYSVDYEAEDDRTPIDKLKWSLETNTSDWLGTDPETGVLRGTPELKDVGSYWVKVSVFDGEDGWDYTNFTLWVTTEPITKFEPKLSNPSLTPSGGDTNTEFTFSVDYSHLNDEEPDSIQVVIDGFGYDLTSTNGQYEYSTKLSEGNHTYYFATTLGVFTDNTDTFNTSYINKAEEQREDGDGDSDEDNTMLYVGIGIGVIIIIVILVLLFIFLKKKKEKEEEPPVEEIQPPPPEEVPPEAPPPEQPPTSEVPQEQVPVLETPIPEQPQASEVSPEQIPTPESPQPEQPPPTPKVTPQVEAQETTVEQPVEPQQQPAPTIKTQPTIEENDT